MWMYSLSSQGLKGIQPHSIPYTLWQVVRMAVCLRWDNVEPFVYSGIAGSGSISIFVILTELQTDFPNSWSDLHSHQQCV